MDSSLTSINILMMRQREGFLSNSIGVKRKSKNLDTIDTRLLDKIKGKLPCTLRWTLLLFTGPLYATSSWQYSGLLLRSSRFGGFLSVALDHYQPNKGTNHGRAQ
jgi:hypothetical protein